MHLHGPGERPTLMAKEFALDQMLRDGRTVHRHKGIGLTLALLMYGPRNELFADAALPTDEDRGVGVCNA